MTDPAVEAAKRVVDKWVNDTWNASRHFVAEAAAREALAPIRDAIAKHDQYLASSPRPYYDDRADSAFDAVDEIRELVFSSEELDD